MTAAKRFSRGFTLIELMVLYLASDEAAWVTGATFPIDGGMTISKG